MGECARGYTKDELMAVVISRNIRNGDRALTGMATGGRTGVLAVGIPLVGMALAQMSHAPDATILYDATIVNPKVDECPTLFETGRGKDSCRAEARLTLYAHFAMAQRGEITVGFSSVAQVDKYGNVNITAIGNYHRPRVRLVGNIFETEHYTLHQREILVMDHERRNFVEKVDYITGPGYINGFGAREKAGLRWGGPCMCVTNLAVLGFDGKTRQMKLESVHPGVSVAQVKENTGFDLIIPKNVSETEPPTVEQVELIRNKIDPRHVLIPREGTM